MRFVHGSINLSTRKIFYPCLTSGDACLPLSHNSLSTIQLPAKQSENILGGVYSVMERFCGEIEADTQVHMADGASVLRAQRTIVFMVLFNC